MTENDELESDMDQPTREIDAYSGEDDDNNDDEDNEGLNERDGHDDSNENIAIDATDDEDSAIADAADDDEVATVETEEDGASSGTPVTSEGGDNRKKKKSSPVSARRTGRKGRTPSVAGLTIPFRTVKKAMKLDPDTPIVQNEAAIMTTIAAELFLKRLAKESFHSAKLRGRNTIRYEDIAEARTKNPSMTFLETLLP